jgi:hypothetical protein
MIFAATHPERTSALVLGNTVARYAKAEDYPEGATPEVVEQILEMFRATWGTEQLIAGVFPSMASDPAFLRWRAKFTRASATPRTAAAQYRYIFGMDVRSVLSTIAVPTLVLHRSNFSLVPIQHGRYRPDVDASWRSRLWVETCRFGERERIRRRLTHCGVTDLSAADIGRDLLSEACGIEHSESRAPRVPEDHNLLSPTRSDTAWTREPCGPGR